MVILRADSVEHAREVVTEDPMHLPVTKHSMCAHGL